MQGTASNDYVRKLDELDRLLNDPGVPMQPELIWRLLDEIAKWEHDRPWHGALLDHRADGEQVTRSYRSSSSRNHRRAESAHPLGFRMSQLSASYSRMCLPGWSRSAVGL